MITKLLYDKHNTLPNCFISISNFQIALQNILAKKKFSTDRNRETRRVNSTNLTTSPILPSPSPVVDEDPLSIEGDNDTINDSYITNENGTNILSHDGGGNFDGSSTIESEFGTFNIKWQNDNS